MGFYLAPYVPTIVPHWFSGVSVRGPGARHTGSGTVPTSSCGHNHADDSTPKAEFIAGEWPWHISYSIAREWPWHISYGILVMALLESGRARVRQGATHRSSTLGSFSP